MGCGSLTSIGDAASRATDESRDTLAEAEAAGTAPSIDEGAKIVRSATVRDISGFAQGAGALEEVDLSREADGVWVRGEGATMERAFAGCGSLSRVRLASVLEGALARAGSAFALAGWGASGGEIAVSGSLLGDGADASSFAEGAGFSRVTVEDTLTGAGASAREAFSGCARLSELSFLRSATGAGCDLTRAFSGCGTDGSLTGAAYRMDGSGSGGGSWEALFEGSLSGEGLGSAVLSVAGGGAGAAPSSMSRAFSGMARLTGADLTGMPAACRDVSRAFAGMSAEAAVDVAVSMGGSGAAAGAVKLPERWDLTGAADASGIFAGAGFSSVEISGLGAASGLALEEAFAGCARLERVSLTGSASGHVANLRGAFAGCGALASVDLSGISTSGMGGSQASYGELSAMSGMWAGSGLVTGTGDATVKVGAGWTKVLNGFFGERAHAGAVPAYVLREGVRVEVTGGPAAAADLMPCPEGLFHSTWGNHLNSRFPPRLYSLCR